MTPVHVRNRQEAARLERNLTSDGKPGRKPEDPQKTIQRLRAEVAVLKELLDYKQEIINKLNREIGAMRGRKV